ncbi:type II toxin-antitoxin system PemK/MazF family toxin [Aminobacter sp. AP02]|uniref:type II toxin-antitoxin system PemK/MazF family toxin n=1 Tax=Aminobacter sp. AP02 TaxID=2135737 RepID=UPI000D6C1AF6|nr:type II toxin-antitoxin system PemK/MazF family toxin [Aminobacter sp. AP02]PWK63880.1 mRNA interferase MazF [Aminobacter sp. AP02]
MTYSRFDVILVNFPFTEKRGQKRRPAIVLSNYAFNTEHNHAVTAMVTTASNTIWQSDLSIADFADAGLRTPCVTRMKLFTVADDLILGRIGTLSTSDQARLALAIQSLFAP